MYDPEIRKYCPMRGNLGNCSPVGGFCVDAVSDEICEAVHNAYDQGLHNAIKMLKDQEAVEGHWIPIESPTGVEAFGIKEMTVQYVRCSACGAEDDVSFAAYRFCPRCGTKMESR